MKPTNSRRLPDLEEKINALTAEVDRGLEMLPEIPSNKVQHIVRRDLTKFSNEVTKILQGNSNLNLFHSDWMRLCDQFLKAIEFMKPGCNLAHPADKIRETIVIDDSDNESTASRHSHSQLTPRRQRDEMEYSANRGNKRQRLNDTPIPINLSTPSSRILKQENGSMPAPFFASPSARKLTRDDMGPFLERYLDSGFRAMPLVDIQAAIQGNSKAGVPEYDTHTVKERYAMQAIDAWEGPLQTFIKQTFGLLREQILSTLASTLQNHLHTELFRASNSHIEKFLEILENEQTAAIMSLLEIEKGGLFTLNKDAFNRYKAEAYDALQRSRRAHRVQCYAEAQYKNKHPNDPEKEKESREKYKSNVTDEQLGIDPCQREVDVAAYIRGYYTTAKFRFVDSVCLNMHSRYFDTITKKIEFFLEEKFGLDQGDSEAICQALLEGSPEVARERSRLRNRKQQLLEFSKTFEELKIEVLVEEPARGSDESFSTLDGSDFRNGQ